MELSKTAKKRGGPRTAGEGKRMGRPPKPKPENVTDKNAAAKILDALNRPESGDDSYEIKQLRIIDKAGARESLDLRKYLYDKRDGKAVHTVNHLHDKPLEMNINHTISERMRMALEKAEKRVSGSH